MTLILASQSPRRKEILSYFSIPFEVRASHFDESSITFEGDPVTYVRTLARRKAGSLEVGQDDIVLAADTIVYRDGKVYEKPKDSEEALAILKELVGCWHSVYTGVAVRRGRELFDDIEETRVLFNSPTEEQMRRYQDTLHCSDKAGGYAIQEGGSVIVHSIEGCYYNVMGLPINTLNALLTQVGLSLWDHLG